MKFIVMILAALASPAHAVYYSNSFSTATGKASMIQAGNICIAASSSTSNVCTVLINGQSGTVDGYDISSQFNSIALSTALPRGHDIEDEGIDIPLRSTINFVGAGVTVTDSGGKTIVTVAATGDVLRSTAAIFGTVTTNSPAWATVPGSNLSITMSSAQYVSASLTCNIECLDFTQCGVAFGLLVDGANTSGQTASTSSGFAYLETPASTTDSPLPLYFRYKTTGKLAAGTHQLALLWASTGGVSVQMGRNTRGCSVEYSESPEEWNTATGGGSGGAPGITDFGAKSQAEFQTLTCSVLPCRAQGTFGMYDLWIATGTGTGQWMNARTGIGP